MSSPSPSPLLRHRLLLSPGLDRPPTHLDRTLSISFAVLLCAILTYLVASSLRQFCCRDQLQHPSSPTEAVSTKDEDPECRAQLRAIPVQIYSSQVPRSCAGIAPEAESCSVCLEEYQTGEEVRVLPGCKHMFHKACVDQWLVTRSSFCPVCRDRVIERAVEPMVASCMRNEGNDHQEGAGRGRGSVILQVSVGMNILSAHHSTLM